MKVFVTGGSGFVGGHLIEHLVREGHEVRALARSDKSADVVRGYGATPARADLERVKAADLEGAEAVIHCAAYAEEWGTRKQFWEGNVEGTARMLEVTRAAGARRFVHVGTEAALFDGHDLVDIDETHPYPVCQRFLYSETKAEAERRVMAASDAALTTLSVRPRLVWGPRDATVAPVVLKMAREGRFAWLDRGKARTSTTHVLNLAHALTLALTRGTGGRAYFVADDGTRTLREFLTALARAHGVELPARSVPGVVARPLAVALEGLWRSVGLRHQPPMTAMAIAMMSRTVTVKTGRARAELGYAPLLSFEEGMRALGEGANPRAAGA